MFGIAVCVLIIAAVGFIIHKIIDIYDPTTVCKHYKTICIHGDSITAYTSISVLPWKKVVVNRQICLECGSPLNRPSICTATGDPTLHSWTGPWLFYDFEENNG